MKAVSQALVNAFGELAPVVGHRIWWVLAAIVAAAGLVLAIRAIRRRLARPAAYRGPVCPHCTSPFDGARCMNCTYAAPVCGPRGPGPVCDCPNCGQEYWYTERGHCAACGVIVEPPAAPEPHPVYCGSCGGCHYCNYGQS